MSWSNFAREGRFTGLIVITLILAGCGFRPLYLQESSAVTTSTGKLTNIGKELASVSVQLANTRESIALRNNLIFAFTGSGDEGPNPAYQLEFNVIKASSPFTVEAISGRQSASFVTMTVTYKLIRAGVNEVVFNGRAIGRSSFDKPAQRFAAIRAERDAEDRALQDVAEAVRNALAGYFAQKDKPAS